MRFRFAALAAFAALFATPAAAAPTITIVVDVRLPDGGADEVVVTANMGGTDLSRKVTVTKGAARAEFNGAGETAGIDLQVSVIPLAYRTIAALRCGTYKAPLRERMVVGVVCSKLPNNARADDETPHRRPRDDAPAAAPATEPPAAPEPVGPAPPQSAARPPSAAPPMPAGNAPPVMELPADAVAPAGGSPPPTNVASGGGAFDGAGGSAITGSAAPPPRRYRPPGMKPSGGSAPPRAAPSGLPDFQWPPPAPSERMNLQRARIAAGLPAKASLLDLANKMTGALNGAGYSEYSFFRAPNGFALVARLEQFNPDGSPKPQSLRFLDPNAAAPFSLSAYVKQLFFAPEGYYRLIVFVVTNEAFAASAPSPTAASAEAWLRTGANTLPQQYAHLVFSPGHQVTALIYEFRKHGNAPIATLDPGQLDANTHLMKAGLLERLLR